jgi:hypothetical protein
MEGPLGLTWAEQGLEMAGSPEDCFAAIADYESFPEWQRAVEEVEVLDRYPDGLGRNVRVRVDARFRVVTYELEYHYERPARVWWDFVRGEGIRAIEGEFRFEPSGAGTLATYRLGIDPGVPVPGLIARRLTGEVMKRSVTDLRDEVERRWAAHDQS